MFLKSALGHCFRHYVDIRRMVEVAVGNDNGAEFLRVQLAFGHLDDAARAGVHQYLGAVQIKPDAAGGKQLADNHKTGAAGAEKGYCLFGLISLSTLILL